VAAIALQTRARRTPAAPLAARAGGALAAPLRALAHWWFVGRRYRPERRYMRGGSGAHGVAISTAAR
jgi:hypothetical protein